MPGDQHEAAISLQRSWRGHGVRMQNEQEVARAQAELLRLGWQPVPKGQTYVGYRYVHAASGLSSGLGSRQLLHELLHDEQSPLRGTVADTVGRKRSAAAAVRELLNYGWAPVSGGEQSVHEIFVHNMSGQQFICPGDKDACYLLDLVLERQRQEAAQAEELSSVAPLPPDVVSALDAMHAFTAVFADGPDAHELLINVPETRRAHAQAIALACGTTGVADLKLLLQRITEAESDAAVAAVAEMPVFAQLEIQWWHMAASVPCTLRARVQAIASSSGMPKENYPVLLDRVSVSTVRREASACEHELRLIEDILADVQYAEWQQEEAGKRQAASLARRRATRDAKIGPRVCQQVIAELVHMVGLQLTPGEQCVYVELVCQRTHPLTPQVHDLSGTHEIDCATADSVGRPFVKAARASACAAAAAVAAAAAAVAIASLAAATVATHHCGYTKDTKDYAPASAQASTSDQAQGQIALGWTCTAALPPLSAFARFHSWLARLLLHTGACRGTTSASNIAGEVLARCSCSDCGDMADGSAARRLRHLMDMQFNTTIGDGEVIQVLAPWIPTSQGFADARRSARARAFEPVLSPRLWLPSAVVSSRLNAISGPKLTHQSIFGGNDIDSLDITDISTAATEMDIAAGAIGQDERSATAQAHSRHTMTARQRRRQIVGGSAQRGEQQPMSKWRPSPKDTWSRKALCCRERVSKQQQKQASGMGPRAQRALEAKREQRSSATTCSAQETHRVGIATVHALTMSRASRTQPGQQAQSSLHLTLRALPLRSINQLREAQAARNAYQSMLANARVWQERQQQAEDQDLGQVTQHAQGQALASAQDLGQDKDQEQESGQTLLSHAPRTAAFARELESRYLRYERRAPSAGRAKNLLMLLEARFSAAGTTTAARFTPFTSTSLQRHSSMDAEPAAKLSRRLGVAAEAQAWQHFSADLAEFIRLICHALLARALHGTSCLGDDRPLRRVQLLCAAAQRRVMQHLIHLTLSGQVASVSIVDTPVSFGLLTPDLRHVEGGGFVALGSALSHRVEHLRLPGCALDGTVIGALIGPSQLGMMSEPHQTTCKSPPTTLRSLAHRMWRCAAPSVPIALLTLDLSRNPLKDEGVCTLCDALFGQRAGSGPISSPLQELHLCATMAGDAGASAVASALRSGSAPFLRLLDLSQCHVGAQGARNLAQALIVTSYNTDAVVKSAGGSCCSSLTHLLLAGNQLREAGASALAEALVDLRHHPKYEPVRTALQTELNLDCCPDRSKVLLRVKKLLAPHDPRVATRRDRVLFDKRPSFAECERAAVLRVASAVVSQSAAETHGNNVPTTHWTSFTHKPTLVELDLSFNGIGAKGAAALGAALETNVSLRTLRLARNGVGATGASALAAGMTVQGAGAEPGDALIALDLSRNGLGVEGARALRPAVQSCSALLALDVRHNALGEIGAAILQRGAYRTLALDT